MGVSRKTTKNAGRIGVTPTGIQQAVHSGRASTPKAIPTGSSESGHHKKRASSGYGISPPGGGSGTHRATGHPPPVGGGKGKTKTFGDMLGGGATEIGYDRVRGWPLRLKFLVFTLLVVLLITSLFGYVAISGLRSSIIDEIVLSGHQQILGLAPFSRHVLKTVKLDALNKKLAETRDPQLKNIIDEILNTVRKNGNPYELVNNYREQADKQLILKTLEEVENKTDEGMDRVEGVRTLLDGYAAKHKDDSTTLGNLTNDRVKDIVIFSTYSMHTPVLRATNSTYLTQGGEEAPSANVNKEKNEEIYWGSYDKERCLYFHLPVRAAFSELSSPNNTGQLYLIMSAASVNSKVRSLVAEFDIFGMVFAIAGVTLAWFLASMIAKPVNVLVEDVNTVAKGELEHESQVPNMTSDEIGLLARAFNRMTRNLRDARDKEREAQRLAGEVNTAKGIHMRLLPEKLPNLPEIFDIACAYNCAKEVGGDYYDFIPVAAALPAENLGFCVADVSGKGIPGSMVMGTTRTYLRMMAMNNYSAADVLAKTNAWVVRDIKRGMFITCVYVILNLRTRELTVASAGHNPILIWRQATRQVEKLRPNGIALGFDKGPIFNRTIREEKVQLHSGDRVVMYTDGVVEAMNEKHEEWTDERLERFTLSHATMPSKEYVRLLLKALQEHQGRAEQHDDITVVTFKMV